MIEENCRNSSSNKSSSNENSTQLPPHLRYTELQLANILIEEFPEFCDKNKLYEYYADYDFPQQQKKNLVFWNHALEIVMNRYFHSCKQKFQNIYKLFVLGTFEPIGLSKIFTDLVKQQQSWCRVSDTNNIMALLDLNPEAQQQQQQQNKKQQNSNTQRSYLSYLNPFSYFQSQSVKQSQSIEPEEPHLVEECVNVKLLKHEFKIFMNIISSIYDDSQVQKEKVVDQILKNSDLKQFPNDIEFLKDLLIKNGQLKRYEQDGLLVFLKDRKEQKNLMNNVNQFKLQNSINVLEKKEAFLQSQNEELDTKIKKLITAQMKKQAIQLFQQKKQLELEQSAIQNKIQVLHKLLNQLELAQQDQEIVGIMESAQNVLKDQQINPDKMLDLQQDIAESDQNQKELNEIYKQINPIDNEEIENMYAQYEKSMIQDNNKQPQQQISVTQQQSSNSKQSNQMIEEIPNKDINKIVSQNQSQKMVEQYQNEFQQYMN